MPKADGKLRVRRSVVAALISGAMLLVGTQASLANCGGHCQQTKVCSAQVKAKGIKDASKRHDEYNKCMTDPHSYQ